MVIVEEMYVKLTMMYHVMILNLSKIKKKTTHWFLWVQNVHTFQLVVGLWVGWLFKKGNFIIWDKRPKEHLFPFDLVISYSGIYSMEIIRDKPKDAFWLFIFNIWKWEPTHFLRIEGWSNKWYNGYTMKKYASIQILNNI